MSRRRSLNRATRGFTLAEMLTVLLILGVVGSLIAYIVRPIITAPNQEQAKVDTLQAGARAMYMLQRDLRQTNVNGVYVCTYPAPSTCSSAPGTLTSTPVIAILTARQNGNGQVQYDPSNGQAKWQGFNIYWLAPSAQGGTDLVYAFEPNFSIGSGAPQQGVLAGTANTVVNEALLLTKPYIAATGVTQLQTQGNATTDTVGLKLTGQTTVGGRTNETTYESDTVARNQ